MLKWSGWLKFLIDSWFSPAFLAAARKWIRESTMSDWKTIFTFQNENWMEVRMKSRGRLFLLHWYWKQRVTVRNTHKFVFIHVNFPRQKQPIWVMHRSFMFVYVISLCIRVVFSGGNLLETTCQITCFFAFKILDKSCPLKFKCSFMNFDELLFWENWHFTHLSLGLLSWKAHNLIPNQSDQK